MRRLHISKKNALKKEGKMKLNKIVLIILLVFGIFSFFTLNSYASEWYTCAVGSAGVLSSGYVQVKLTDTTDSPAFENTYFRVYTGREKEMLAIFLTAMSIGYNVKAKLDCESSKVKYRIIYHAYCTNE
jgi:hypothetical protein